MASPLVESLPGIYGTLTGNWTHEATRAIMWPMLQQLLAEVSALFEGSIQAVSTVAPRLMVAAVLLVLGLVIAYVVRSLGRRLIGRVLQLLPARVQRNRRAGELRRYADLTVGRVLFWAVLVLFAFPASETLGVPVISAWFNGAARYLPQLFAAALIVFGGFIGGRLLADMIARAAPAAGFIHAAALGRTAQVVTLIVSVLVAVDQAGLSVGFLTDALLLTLAGGLLGGALTFALGARATVANILASAQLRKLYRVGHRVRIGDFQGEIVATTATSVVLDSEDGHISVPASIFDRQVSIRLLEQS